MITRLAASVVYFILWLVGGFVFILPFELKSQLARALGNFWYYFVPFRKHVILHNLVLVFPRAVGESNEEYKQRLFALCKKNLIHYCLSFIETLERFHWNPAVVERRVDVVGKENLEALMRENRGFFILSSHIGNWELITLIGVKLGVKLAILTKFLRNGFWDQIWVRSRKAFGLELIKERHSGLEIARAIQKGRAVGFILDQHTGEPHGIESLFMGHPAWTAKGLAILSYRLKAPVLPAFLIRKEDGNFEVHIEKAFESTEVLPENFRVESGPLRQEALEFHVRKCNAIMEQWTYDYPEQYLWIHKRFKNIIDYKRALPWS